MEALVQEKNFQVVTLREFSKSQNWLAAQWPDQTFWQ